MGVAMVCDRVCWMFHIEILIVPKSVRGGLVD